ncbi:hypothetical protein ACIA8E_24860 [Streptomyces sp. NPDC051664]|uniref:hypothetical protein n=1 Tax=Streptomyces sp. NPDC051664 TaxID=3365668 RepID=UPI0037979FA2
MAAVIPVVPAVPVAGTLALVGLDAPDGPIPIQVPPVMCAMTAALVAKKNGHSRSAVQRAGQGALSYPPYAVLDHASPALSVLHGISRFEIEMTQLVTAGPVAH